MLKVVLQYEGDVLALYLTRDDETSFNFFCHLYRTLEDGKTAARRLMSVAECDGYWIHPTSGVREWL